MSSTTMATMTPMPSVEPMAGACATAPPPSSIRRPSTSLASAIAASSVCVASGISVIWPLKNACAKATGWSGETVPPGRRIDHVGDARQLLGLIDDRADGLLVGRFGQRLALRCGEDDAAGGVTGAGDLLAQLVERGLRRGARDGERGRHRAGEGGRGSAEADQQRQPDDQHRPAPPGGEVSESVQQCGHVVLLAVGAGSLGVVRIGRWCGVGQGQCSRCGWDQRASDAMR